MVVCGGWGDRGYEGGVVLVAARSLVCRSDSKGSTVVLFCLVKIPSSSAFAVEVQILYLPLCNTNKSCNHHEEFIPRSFSFRFLYLRVYELKFASICEQIQYFQDYFSLPHYTNQSPHFTFSPIPCPQSY